MSGYLNKVQLIGNLGKDPEIRHSQDGTKIATLNIATTEYWRDKTTNERRDRTEWHKVVIFNERLCEVAEKYLRKGSKIYIEGQLQTRKWTDNNGQERFTTEVVLQRFRGELMMMDTKGQEGDTSLAAGFDNYPASSTRDESKTGSMKNFADDLNDEIPF